MKWRILSKGGDVLETLLINRGIKTKKAREEFLNPPSPKFKLDLSHAYALVRSVIKNKEKIVVYGDYDADGICATAIIWEWLKNLGADVLPYLPTREKDGYGLSIEGIKNIDAKLIITVDNGITAHEAVNFANSKKIDVIILDHHQKPASLSGGPKKLPKAKAIIWTDKLCASGIAYFVAKTSVSTMNYELRATNSWLELAAIATITDLLPLTGINRSIVKYGLESLNQTSRVGLKALFEAAGIEKITPYEIGYMIGPRLNASGRIDSALTALRLLCTHNKEKAREYVQILNQLNKERQEMTEEMTIHAKQKVESRKQKEKIIIIDHESYHQGVIGLVAGKLVDQFYLPAIVIAKGQEVSKASARSIFGFNIIEAIRSCESLLINAGGHPMAAGFSIETNKISNFKFQISNYAQRNISADTLRRSLKIDRILELQEINMNLYQQIVQMAPFGMGNPEPVFASSGIIQNLRTVGAEGKHLKLAIDDFDAIFFNGGHFLPQLKIGQKIKLAYSLALDTFNGNNKLQLKVRDLQL